MVHDDGAVLAAVQHRVLEIRLGFLVLPEQVQDPGVGVQVSGVVRIRIHRLLGHGQCLLELLALQGQVVGVVVQDRSIVRVDLEDFFVGLIGLLRIPLHMVHVADLVPGVLHQLRVLGLAGDEVPAVVDDGVVVLQVVIGRVQVFHEAQLLETVEGRDAAGLDIFPALRHQQDLDDGNGLAQALGIEVGGFLEAFDTLVHAAGRVVIAAGGGEGGTVVGVRLPKPLHHPVEAVPMQVDDLRVQAADDVAHVHSLRLHGDTLVRDERVHGREILRIAAGGPEHFGPAQDGGHIVALGAERLLIGGERQGVLVFAQIVVPHHRKDGRGGELVVEVLEGRDGLFVLAHLPQDVIPGADGLLARADDFLDVVQRLQRLLVLVLLEIQAQQVVEDIGLVREFLEDAFVHLDDHVILAGGVVEVRQTALVPIVVRIQLHGLPQTGDGRVGVAQHGLVQTQVIPDGVVVGSRL